MDDDNQNKKGYSSQEDFWENLQNFFDLHYRPPKVNESVVNELVKRYKRNHPDEFPNLKKLPPKGYPANPPGNLPPS
jgi:hypothetical protein